MAAVVIVPSPTHQELLKKAIITVKRVIVEIYFPTASKFKNFCRYKLKISVRPRRPVTGN
jgi:hypothetical protein